MNRLSLLLLVLGIATGCSCESEEPMSGATTARTAPAEDIEDNAVDPVRPIAGGISWTAEDPLVYVRPENSMRVAEYEIRGAEVPANGGAKLLVSHFPPVEGGGGDVAENIDRWLGQFTQPDGRSNRDAARIVRREVAEVNVTTLDISGTFVGRLGMGGPAEPRENWRMMGAIAEGSEGPVFFKLLGHRDTVERARAAFEALIESIEPR